MRAIKSWYAGWTYEDLSGLRNLTGLFFYSRPVVSANSAMRTGTPLAAWRM